MTFIKGNDLYKIRETDGRPTIYETSEAIVKKANEYFQWCLDNPLKEQVIINKAYQDITKDKDGNEITVTRSHDKTTVDKMRPFTLAGLCIFMGISLKTFYNYEKRSDFLQVTSRIREIIDNFQFEGAAANLLNANLIARRLGMVDRQDITSGDKPIATSSADDIDNRIEHLLAKRAGKINEDEN